MRNFLIKKVSEGKIKPKLQNIYPEILPSAWLILRWFVCITYVFCIIIVLSDRIVLLFLPFRCVASCTAYLEEITNKNELVRGLGIMFPILIQDPWFITALTIGPDWRQFRFNVGAPSAEAEFQRAVQEAQQANPRAEDFPVLYVNDISTLA